MMIALLMLELCTKQTLCIFCQFENGEQKTRFCLSRYVLIVILMFCLNTAKLNDKQTPKLGGCLLISLGKNVPLSINN